MVALKKASLNSAMPGDLFYKCRLDLGHFVTNNKLEKMKESCWLVDDKHLFLKYFLYIAFVGKVSTDYSSGVLQARSKKIV